MVAEAGSTVGVQREYVVAGRADAEGDRLPPFVEADLRDLNRQLGVLGYDQAGLGEQAGEVTLADPWA